jgi:hypothetical protein
MEYRAGKDLPSGSSLPEGRSLPISLSMAISFSLAISAAVVWFTASSSLKSYCMWILIGMLFSTLGDIIMAGLIKVPDRLIFGMLSFGITHVLYIAAFIGKIAQKGNGLYVIPFIAYIIILIILWSRYIYRSSAEIFLKIAVLIYGTIIAYMAASAFNLSIHWGGTWWLAAAGGLLFFLSDIIIALAEIGRVYIKDRNLVIWITYILGQGCIIYSAWLQGL